MEFTCFLADFVNDFTYFIFLLLFSVYM
jgi:hypothetical protein